MMIQFPKSSAVPAPQSKENSACLSKQKGFHLFHPGQSHLGKIFQSCIEMSSFKSQTVFILLNNLDVEPD
jgi:hypothetical protein